MKRKLLWAGLAALLVWPGAASSADGRRADNPPRVPVLVELFTSEGCSSCPPADALLERLDRTQPVDGAQIIVLSEHVDYWNRLGWPDPYSAPAYSARQERYARRFRIQGPYTPQMVVDGRAEFVGNDAAEAQSAIRAAIREPKVVVRMAPLPAGKTLTLEVDASAGKLRKAGVYVAQVADSGTSDVLRGENKGRKLHHVSVVGDLRQVGTVDGRAGFRTELTLPAHMPAGSRLVAFVQEPDNGPVWGAAVFALPR